MTSTQRTLSDYKIKNLGSWQRSESLSAPYIPNRWKRQQPTKLQPDSSASSERLLSSPLQTQQPLHIQCRLPAFLPRSLPSPPPGEGLWLCVGVALAAHSRLPAVSRRRRRRQQPGVAVRAAEASQCPQRERFKVTMDTVSAWAPGVGFTLLPHVGGILGGLITDREIHGWYEYLEKPSWCPPNWMFAPVWGTLYTSMGYGSYLVWKELGGFNKKSLVPLGLYAGQLALNWSWTPIFFGAHKTGWGLVALLLTAGAATATTSSWYHVNKTSAYLMFPYLAWLTLASALNYRIWKDNPNKKKP
uniref:Translocator protein n=2 Tax=Crocodylus porosus TaxID=8502 RepID=A0A7M4E4A7_CROPO